MEPQDNQTPQKPSKGYGKRPIWQWVVLYTVVAAIVYYLAYILFLKGDGVGY